MLFALSITATICQKTGQVIYTVVRSLFPGGSAPSELPLPPDAPDTAEILEDAHRKLTAGEVRRRLDAWGDATPEARDTYAYLRASVRRRAKMDVRAIRPHVLTWLVEMSDSKAARLRRGGVMALQMEIDDLQDPTPEPIAKPKSIIGQALELEARAHTTDQIRRRMAELKRPKARDISYDDD
jgi:hypothetical protein